MNIQQKTTDRKEVTMKVLLYAEGLKTIGKSGLGKAIKHQMNALENEHIPYTLDSKEEYDILHINTWFIKSYFFAKKAKKKGKKIVIMPILPKKILKILLLVLMPFQVSLRNGLFVVIA